MRGSSRPSGLRANASSGCRRSPTSRSRISFERGLSGHGTGLGLAIAKAYATAHGGDLLYEPGAQGARFEVVLPVRRP